MANKAKVEVQEVDQPIVDEAPELAANPFLAISEEEYQRRIKLDVSNPEYINPSYDR